MSTPIPAPVSLAPIRGRLDAAEAALADKASAASVAQVENDVALKASTVDLTALRAEFETAAKAKARMEIIAHRGFLDAGVQNTLLAMSHALAAGADSLECDVQITSDGVPVIFHDDTVDALTDGTGAIKDLTLAAVRALRYDKGVGSVYDPVRIDTWDAMLRFVKRAGCRIYAEIKAYRTLADLDLMLAPVYQYDLEQMVIWQSFTMSTLDAVRALRPNARVGYLAGTTWSPADADQLAALGNAWLLPQQTVVVANPSLVTYCKARGVNLAAWTIQNSLEATTMMQLGVSSVMSDYAIGRIF